MRLSEAVILGDTLRRRSPTLFIDEDENGSKCGCAIGGATLAMGKCGNRDHEEFWPWLSDIAYKHPSDYDITWESAIGIYGYKGKPSFLRVCDGLANLEQLVDWIREVEPECDKCCRFECTCADIESLPKTAEEVYA